MTPVFRCSRCSRRLRHLITAETDGWKVILDVGIVTTIICPGCVTSAEHVEAEVNDTMTEVLGTHGGRIYGRPKLGGDNGDERRDG